VLNWFSEEKPPYQRISCKLLSDLPVASFLSFCQIHVKPSS
jgi:hypothetical protein